MHTVNRWRSADVYFSHETDSVAPEEKLNIRHCHSTYEILFVVGGEGRYLVEGSEYLLCPGTLMLFRPTEYHSVTVSGRVPYERYVIHFPASSVIPSAAAFLSAMEAHGDEKGSLFYPATATSHTLMSVFARMEAADRIPTDKRHVYIEALLSEIIVLLSTADVSRLSPDGEELAVRVLRYINENLDKDISLDALARRFFVSKYYLCRAFRKRHGVSVHGYITHKRVMYAKQLIEAGEAASAAAYRVGFGDYSAFYRAYSKINGESPIACAKKGT